VGRYQRVQFGLAVLNELGKRARELVRFSWKDLPQRAAQQVALINAPDGSPSLL
jgi:hypothetical protein